MGLAIVHESPQKKQGRLPAASYLLLSAQLCASSSHHPTLGMIAYINATLDLDDRAHPWWPGLPA